MNLVIEKTCPCGRDASVTFPPQPEGHGFYDVIVKLARNQRPVCSACIEREHTEEELRREAARRRSGGKQRQDNPTDQLRVVMETLGKVRWDTGVSEPEIRQLIDLYPTLDPIAAASTAGAWRLDPNWREKDPTRTFHTALRSQLKWQLRNREERRAA